ncbi:MAG: major capsid protein [Spirochaetales bacterium]|jgi:hypothetical protein|nr:major capsid protein [Spirochaetales bacterium]
MIRSDLEKLKNKVVDLKIDIAGRRKTPLLDILFPRGGREWLKRTFTIYEDGGATENIPCVDEGASSYPLKRNPGTVRDAYPMKLFPSKFLTGEDILEMSSFTDMQVNSFLESKRQMLINTIFKSMEAQAATIFTGTEGTMSYYKALGTETIVAGDTINFGTMGTAAYTDVPGAVGWDQPAATISDITSVLQYAKLQVAAEYRGSGIFLCGQDMWNYAAAIVDSHDGTIRNENTYIDRKNNVLYVQGYELVYIPGTYYTIAADGTRTAADFIADNSIFWISDDLPRDLLFFRTANIEKGFPAAAYVLDGMIKKDPPGVKMLAESRPLPYLYSAGICSIDAYDGT